MPLEIDRKYEIEDCDAIPSPSLVVYLPIVKRNIAKMVAMAGSVARLRPHAKTHKMPALVKIQVESFGITKFKCATIAEAEMIAQVGESLRTSLDVLLAYPLVGPNVGRFAKLVAAYPRATLRATVDHRVGVEELNRALADEGQSASALVDLDVGMGRTGVGDVEEAAALLEMLERSQHLSGDGFHVYDGHIHDFALADRIRTCDSAFETVLLARSLAEKRGLEARLIVAGGTPTFPCHARRELAGLECSPGTCVFHDAGYGSRFPDLDFEPAAAVLSRVISRPGRERLCLDVGYKSVAGDPPAPRVSLLGLEDAAIGGQSEEHLVVETSRADELAPGSVVLAIPKHICPTCALHKQAYVIDQGRVVAEWETVARDRSIGI